MTGGLEVTRGDGLLRLVLDRPETYNALTSETTTALVRELHAARGDDEVRAVLVTGRGPAFSAGADLTGDDPAANYDGGSVDAANLLIRSVVELGVPVVCGLNGVAAGVGLSLALACDLVVATESATLTVGFAKVGLMTDGGASALLAAGVGRAMVMRMTLLSDVVPAREALAAGLVSHVFADEDYSDGLEKVLAGLVAGAPLALAATKKAINAATLDGLEQAFARERSGQAVLLRTEDAREGMRAFGEKRRPRFQGR